MGLVPRNPFPSHRSRQKNPKNRHKITNGVINLNAFRLIRFCPPIVSPRSIVSVVGRRFQSGDDPRARKQKNPREHQSESRIINFVLCKSVRFIIAPRSVTQPFAIGTTTWAFLGDLGDDDQRSMTRTSFPKQKPSEKKLDPFFRLGSTQKRHKNKCLTNS